MRSSRGVVVLTIILLFSFLIIVFFAYHRVTLSQNRKAVHDSESEITFNLANEGLHFLKSSIMTEGYLTGSRLREETFPQLFSNSDDPEEINLTTGVCRIDGTPVNPDYWLDKIAGNYQRCLNNIEKPFFDRLQLLGGGRQNNPFCQGMSVTLKNMSRLRKHPPTHVDLLSGWDTFERRGEMILISKVYFMGVTKIAASKHQFKMVSFIPGPYSRFTLFSHFAAHPNCYNVVENKFDGSFDTRNGTPYRPLVLYNSIEKVNELHEISVESSKMELSTKGWVYLGQTSKGTWLRDPTTLSGMISLRIPSGYTPNPGTPQPEDVSSSLLDSSGIGGHLYLCPPSTLKSGKLGVSSYQIPSQNIFNPGSGGNSFNVSMRFQGFYTFDPTTNNPDDDGAASLQIWSGIHGALRREDCKTSWVLPFGDRRQKSRTLLFGPAFAEFLQYFILSCTNFSGIILGTQDPLNYSPNQPILLKPWNSNTPKANDFLCPSPNDPPGKKGWKAMKTLSPRLIQARSSGNFCYGFSANMLFDLMAHDVLPDMYNSKSTSDWGIGKMPALSFWVPGNNSVTTLNEMPSIFSDYHSGMQPLTNVHIWRYMDSKQFTPAADENTVFLGNLQQLNFRNETLSDPPFNSIVSNGLLSRVTHLIDFRGVAEGKQKAILCSDIFHADSVSNSGESWITGKQGVFFIRRNKDDGDLCLPSPIKIQKPAILILEHGNFSVMDQIVDVDACGAGNHDKKPGVLFSLVALDGNIKIPSDKEIHAYLVALNTSTSAASKAGGRILSSKNSPNGKNKNRMFIKGGVAVTELASPVDDSTMSNFPAGGVIRYNTLFNPSLKTVNDGYGLVFDKQGVQIDLKEGGQ
ncbi:MAG: hypothetical protein HQM10_21655 [Candidatus Riflebacteria bacterium]|nr:hypothetical protein [Candidatus Riflebacteria bacterium]